MRVEDAATRIGVSERTIWRWITSGRLRTTRVPLPDCGFAHDITVDALVEAADGTPRPEPEHGSRPCYDRGCRCDECRRSQSERHRRWRMAGAS